MSTVNQLLKGARKKRKKKEKSLALKYRFNHLKRKIVFENKPQALAKVKEIKDLTPAKPNSASRSCARVVLLANRKKITVYIPGEKHNIQIHDEILIKGGGAQDVRGVNYSVVRGGRSTKGVEKRKTSRSIYGTKKEKV